MNNKLKIKDHILKTNSKLAYAFMGSKEKTEKTKQSVIIDNIYLECNGIIYNFTIGNYPKELRKLRNIKELFKRLEKETNGNEEEVLNELKSRLDYHLNYKN